MKKIIAEIINLNDYIIEVINKNYTTSKPLPAIISIKNIFLLDNSVKMKANTLAQKLSNIFNESESDALKDLGALYKNNLFDLSSNSEKISFIKKWLTFVKKDNQRKYNEKTYWGFWSKESKLFPLNTKKEELLKLESMSKRFTEQKSPIIQLIDMFNIAKTSYEKLNSIFSNTNLVAKKPEVINEPIVNFISNTKLFLDYVQCRWLKYNLSSFQNNWNEKCRKTYENNFEYRLCYRLRNFVQHGGSQVVKYVKTTHTPQAYQQFILNINEYMVFEGNSFSKLKLAKIDWNDKENSFDKVINRYWNKVLFLFKLALDAYIKCNKKVMSELYLYFKSFSNSTTLHIMWSWVTEQEQIFASDNVPFHPLDTFPEFDELIKILEKLDINISFD